MSVSGMTSFYDRWMQERLTSLYYGHSGYYNYGYWVEGIDSQAQASERLTAELLARIPCKEGRIVDVACGVGGTTRHLLRHYPPSQVIAVNLSASQLLQARMRAPGCRFLQQDAAALGLASGSVDAVICVEAAFHFDTRHDFLREAHRVLKPGGSLVLSDILFRLPGRRPARAFLPAANHLPDLAAYRQLLVQVGFSAVEVEDVTDRAWGAAKRHMRRWPWQAWRAGELGLGELLLTALGVQLAVRATDRRLQSYLLAAARKPAHHDALSAQV